MNKKIALFAIAAASATTFNFAQAELGQNAANKTTRQEIKTEVQAQRAEFKDAKEKMNEERCKNIETRIDTRINRYDNNQQMLQKVYANMTARLDRLAAKLDEAGADTTKFKTDLATLKTMIEKTYTDNTTFINTLKTTQQYTCGNSEGEFKTKLGEARKVLATVKQDRLAIRNFFQSTIRPDLQTIRKELAAKKTTTEKDSNTTKKAETPTDAQL